MKHYQQIIASSAVLFVNLFISTAFAEPLRIGHITWVGFGPLYIAKAHGYFEEQGIEVELTKFSDVKFQQAALAANRIDVVMGTMDGIIRTIAQGQSTRFLFAIDDSEGADGIVADQEVTDVKDLRGRTVAYSVNSAAEFFLKVVLDDAGLSVEDIRTANMATGDAGAAFLAGRVDAAVTWEPHLSRVRAHPRGRVLTDTRNWPGLLVSAASANLPTVETRLSDLQALYRAWIKAVEYQKTNEEEADRIMADGVGGWLKDPAEFAMVRADIRFFDDDGNHAFIGTQVAPGAAVTTMTDAIRLGGLDVTESPFDLIVFEVVNQ